MTTFVIEKSISDMYLFKVLTGKEFNTLFPNVEFVKLTNAKEKHNDFEFKDGLNTDTIVFNPNESCMPGGLYFTLKELAYRWIRYSTKFMKYMRKVTIPDDASVYIEDEKFKADKFILEK